MTEVNTKTLVDIAARYVGPVIRCRPGRANAPDAKEYGEAQYQCICGHAGAMPYPKLFKRLRRKRPMRLTCERCGRVMRPMEQAKRLGR